MLEDMFEYEKAAKISKNINLKGFPSIMNHFYNIAIAANSP